MSKMHITVVTRPKSAFVASKENIQKALIMICGSEIVMKQYPMLINFDRDKPIMHYGERLLTKSKI